MSWVVARPARANNGIGGVGVAPDARLFGVNLLATPDDNTFNGVIGRVMGLYHAPPIDAWGMYADVSNNSWGPRVWGPYNSSHGTLGQGVDAVPNIYQGRWVSFTLTFHGTE